MKITTDNLIPGTRKQLSKRVKDRVRQNDSEQLMLFIADNEAHHIVQNEMVLTFARLETMFEDTRTFNGYLLQELVGALSKSHESKTPIALNGKIVRYLKNCIVYALRSPFDKDDNSNDA